MHKLNICNGKVIEIEMLINKPKLAQFLNFKINFNGGQLYKENLNLVSSQNWKSLNKVGVAEEIGCKNDVALSQIGQTEQRLVKNHVPGWMGVCVGGWKWKPLKGLLTLVKNK